MRKEVILAIVLGLILGAVIVFGYYRTNSSTQTDSNQAQTGLSPTPVVANQDLLTITSPQDGDIFDVAVATISGTSVPSARVVIVTDEEQLFIIPSANGYFSQEINLKGGVNRVQISAINANSEREDRELDLIFTTELNLENYENN